MFSKEQNELLAAPLLRSNVKDRKQSGRTLSYLEGWKVIEEANRIFGFDGWSRETVDLKCVAEGKRMIGEKDGFAGYPGFGVTYIAKARIIVGDIARDGCGTGHGIDRDLGQAHESALKEAETDAMKRALMTFGNQFGLALYDKTQENVVSDGEAIPRPTVRVASRTPAPPAPSVLKSVPRLEITEQFKILDRQLAEAAEHGPEIFQIAYDKLTDEEYAMMKSAIERRHHPRALEVGAK